MKNLWTAWFNAEARPSRRRYLAAIAAAALGLALGTPPQQAHAHDWLDWRDNDKHWVGTWAASPQSVDPFTPASPPSFNGQTIRQIVHTSIGGQKIRVRFTNEFGAEALAIGAAHVALQSSDSSIVAGSDRELTFAGQGSVSIPKGAGVITNVGSANHDTTRWPDGDEFNIFREIKPHIAFGVGVHMCLGMHLARMEMAKAVDRLIERCPNLRFDDEAFVRDDVHIHGENFRSPTSLPVLFG